MIENIECAVDLYSGRPNPTLRLSDEDWAELRRRVESARRTPRPERREPPYLGFRGYRIYNPKLEAGLPYKVAVFGGFVTITEYEPRKENADAAAPQHFADEGRLEEWLEARAVEQGLAKDIEAVRKSSKR